MQLNKTIHKALTHMKAHGLMIKSMGILRRSWVQNIFILKTNLILIVLSLVVQFDL